MHTTTKQFSTKDIERLKQDILKSIKKTEDDLFQNQSLKWKIDFFLSSIFPYSRYKTLDEILRWLEDFRKNNKNSVELIGIEDLQKWYVEEHTGNIRHESGKFFSIEGVRIKTGSREVDSWFQPIINQPEIGILGILVKKVEGIYYFLMQAKTEPGNINEYQISPTVQATKSNYTQIHGGKLPPFVEIFLNRRQNEGVKIIAESLQSEEGARFWKKNNLNVILEIPEQEFAHIPNEFCWMTLYQIKQLLLKDNIINVCARSVLACLP
jgi:oxidase EvaA